MQKNSFFILITLSSFILWFLLITPAAAITDLEGTVKAISFGADAGTLYAGTDDGLYISSNNGRDWTRQALDGQSIADIAVHPINPDILYVAVGKNGVLRSTNRGKDWTALNIKLPDSNREAGDIRALAIEGPNPSTIYAANFQGYIFKSNDEGRSWVVVNGGFAFPALNALAIDPQDSKVLFLGTGSNGVYKTTDSGQTWTTMNTGLEDMTVTRILINPLRPANLFAGTYGGGVFTSEDGGKSWKSTNAGLTNMYIYAMATGPVRGNKTDKGYVRRSDGAELIASVFGGELFRGVGNTGIHWQSMSTKQD